MRRISTIHDVGTPIEEPSAGFQDIPWRLHSIHVTSPAVGVSHEILANGTVEFHRKIIVIWERESPSGRGFG